MPGSIIKTQSVKKKCSESITGSMQCLHKTRIQSYQIQAGKLTNLIISTSLFSVGFALGSMLKIHCAISSNPYSNHIRCVLLLVLHRSKITYPTPLSKKAVGPNLNSHHMRSKPCVRMYV